MSPPPAAANYDGYCYSGGDDQDEPQTVCVMDASGRLGSALVRKLLLRGYAVHAAVQSSVQGCGEEGWFSNNSNSSKTKNKKKKMLRVFEIDVFDYHTIMDALKGCTALFYTFEPPSDHLIYDELMAEVEVRAAHNVLEACAQTPTVHKVVFTSSATAVLWKQDRTSSSSSSSSEAAASSSSSSSSLLINESSWSNITLCRNFKQLWHALSKTMAEKTAWALAMDRDINMVTINGGLLLTSDLTITNPYLKGAAEMYDDGLLVTVDLNFIVDAHICVFEDVSSYGRYLCFNHVVNSHDQVSNLAEILLSSSDSRSSASLLYPPGVREKGVQQRIGNNKLNQLMLGFHTDLRID
ncbi:Cinnamoyl-CoA reductase-like SNL6 [Linum perenne]